LNSAAAVDARMFTAEMVCRQIDSRPSDISAALHEMSWKSTPVDGSLRR